MIEGRDGEDEAAAPAPTSHVVVLRRSTVVGVAAAVALVAVAVTAFVLGRATAPDRATVGRVAAPAPSGASDATATLQQALALHQAGQIDRAAALYQDVLTRDPTNKYALFDLGQIDHSRGDLDTAIARYRAALDTDGTFTPALYNLGLAYSSKGDAADAVTVLQRLVGVDARNAAAHYALGTALVAAGRQSDGEKELATALTLDPSLLKPS